jgi:predicted DNA-binding transcriptional regulator AlpA
MQPLDWLALTKKTVTEVSDDLGMNLATVWRHFHGKRTPSPEDITRYDAYTKSAVTAADWVELAVRLKGTEDQAA